MSDVELPPLPWLKAALHVTTETLMQELAAPSETAPAWSDDEWRVAKAAATIHGISPLLCDVLRWRGPAHWQDFLREQRVQTERRHARILKLLDRIDTEARTRSFAVVALKGAALHALGIYRSGERPMSDVDLLVHSSDLEAACGMLESLDYEASFETWKHIVFAPKGEHAMAQIGEHAANPIKIELHRSTAEQLPFARHDIDDFVLPLRDRPGLHGYPTTWSLMAHLLLHAAGAIVIRGLRALHLEDIARTAARMSTDDWRKLVELCQDDRLWWAFPSLSFVDRHYTARIPAFVLAAARRSCPRHLRRSLERVDLADVSISQPHIHAFPGVEWSRSIAEAVRYMRARVLPGAGMGEIRRAYGGQQSLDVDAPWVRMSQLQRIVSWLGGLRTRVDTLACVRGAWALENKPDARSASPRAPEPAPMSIDAARRWSETVWAEAQAAGPGEISGTELEIALHICRRPVFVCGVHRSGTTLMRDLLDGHPALTVLPSEGTFLTSFEPRLQRLPSDRWLPFMAQEWLRRLANPNNRMPYWTLGPPSHEPSPYTRFARALIAWWPIVQSQLAQSAASWPIVAVALAYAQASGGLANMRVQRWVEKTPTNERFVERLSSEFPDAKIIQMVRHPAAVYASRKAAERARHGSFRNEWQVLADLERSNRIAARSAHEMASDRMIVVRYEDLVGDVASTMNGIAEFLGIEPLPVLHRPTVAGRASASNSSFAVDATPGHVHSTVTSAGSSRLARADFDRIAACIGTSAAPFGYALAPVGWIRASLLRYRIRVDRVLASWLTRAAMSRMRPQLGARDARIRV